MNFKQPGKEPRRALAPFIIFGLFLLLASYVISIFHVIKIQSAHPDEGEGDRVVIRLVHFLSEENVMEAFNKLARDYENMHPDVRIIIQSVPKRAYQQWLNTQQIGGTTPDLFQLEQRGNWTMASRFQEVLTSRVGEVNAYNVGTEMEGVPWRDTYIDGMEGGYFYSLLEFYGIPMTVETSRIFYNKDLFKKVTGSDTPPGNFADLMQICSAIKEYANDRGEKIFPIAATREDVKQYGFHNIYLQSLTGGILIPYDVNAGGGPTSQGLLWGLQTGALDLKSERLRAVYALQLELAQNFQPGFISDMADQARFLFVRQRAAMVLGNTYDFVLYNQTAKFEVGVFKVPLPDKNDPKYGKYYMGQIFEDPITKFLFGLSKSSHNKDIALDFMKFCTSVRNNERFCRQLDWYPAIRNAETKVELKIFAPNDQGVSSFLDFLTAPDIELYFDQNFFLFLGGQLSFDEYMDEFIRIWITKGEKWLIVQRDAISKKEIIGSERNLARSRVKLLFEEAGQMQPGQTMGTGTPYQLGVQIIQVFFGHVFTYRQYVHEQIKNGTYSFPPRNLMPVELFPIPPNEKVLSIMRKPPDDS